MSFDKNLVSDYIATADSWINLNDTLGEINIQGLTEPLINSINADGDVSYILGVNKRYRASTTATVLDAMADVDLLPRSAIHQMQDQLYWLRDNFTPLSAEDDKITKNPEDSNAWGIDEAPSVWTTSRAIIALMTTKFPHRDTFLPKQRTELRDSVYWLAGQAYEDGGWGYQKYSNSPACASSVPMTALAIKAIFLAQRDDVLFNHDAKKSSRFQSIERALVKGKQYLLNHKKCNDRGEIFWCYQDKPGVAISMWALDALQLFTTDGKYWQFKEDYASIEKNVIRFIYSNLPDQDNIATYSQSELFFSATTKEGVKYKPILKQDKRFYTFIPYIVSSLLDRGEDPYNQKIVTMVRWLLNNREQHWVIQEYNASAPCSISAAMAINVIVKWLKKVSQNSFSRSVTAMISNQPEVNSCQFRLPCERPDPVEQDKAIKLILTPTGIILIIALILRAIFPTQVEIVYATWLLSVLLLGLLLNLSCFRAVLVDIYHKKTPIRWEIIYAFFTTAAISILSFIWSIVKSLIFTTTG